MGDSEDSRWLVDVQSASKALLGLVRMVAPQVALGDGLPSAGAVAHIGGAQVIIGSISLITLNLCSEVLSCHKG